MPKRVASHSRWSGSTPVNAPSPPRSSERQVYRTELVPDATIEEVRALGKHPTNTETDDPPQDKRTRTEGIPEPRASHPRTRGLAAPSDASNAPREEPTSESSSESAHDSSNESAGEPVEAREGVTAPPATRVGPGRLATVPLLKTRPYDIVEELNNTKADITVAQLLATSPAQHLVLTRHLKKVRKRSENASEEVLNLVTGTEQSPRMDAIVGKTQSKVIVDGGATTSVMNVDFARVCGVEIKKCTGVLVRLANGQVSAPVGKVEDVPLQIGRIQCQFDAVVMSDLDYEVLLGIPVLKKLRAKTDWVTNSFTFEWYGVKEEVQVFTSLPEDSEAKLVTTADVTEEIEDDTLNAEEVVDELGTRALVTVEDVRRLQLEPKAGLDLVDTSHLREQERKDLIRVLDKFVETLGVDSSQIGRTTQTRHRIQLTTDQPLKATPARMTPAHDQIVNESVERMLEDRVIQRVQSPFTSRVVMVPKKDGSLRFCVDYRRLNRLTVRDNMPLPRIEDVMDSLYGATWFTSLDLQSGYWQIPMEPEDIPKTAFVTKRGTYAFTVMPFGLTNAPATFQRLMNEVLEEYLGSSAIAYLDDVTVYSKSFEMHLAHLGQVLERLRDAGLTLNLGKCQFAKRKIELLGFEIGTEGLGVLSKKVEAIQRLSPPTNVTEVRQFLGLCSYYRKFVPKYGHIASPLCSLLQKDQPFEWSLEHEEAFQALKERLSTAPVLKLPDYGRPFTISTDASDYAVGAVLSQSDELGTSRPVWYLSRKLTSAELKYTTMEKECLAVVYALKHFRHYIWDKPVKLFTDHKALEYLMNGDPPDRGRLSRWYTLIREFDLEILHAKGSSNVVADSLSRLKVQELRRVDTVELCDLVIRILGGNFVGPLTVAMVQLCKKFRLRNNQLLRIVQGKLVPVEQDSRKRQEIIRAAHEDLGHFGTRSTFEVVSRSIWWSGLYRECQAFVLSCHACQVHRLEAHESREFQEVTAEALFERIIIDFVGPLPITQAGNRYILVAIDCYSRWPWAKAVAEANGLATAQFLVEVISMTSVPKILQSDRGSHFVNQAIEVLCEQVGMTHLKSSPYRPQTNGKVERFHRTLIAGISKNITARKGEWDGYITNVLLAYRIKTHRVTKRSPYEIVFGQTARLPTGPEGRTLVSRLSSRTPGTAPIIEPRFRPGEWVLVQKEPIVNKLEPVYEGPFLVVSARGLSLSVKDPTGHHRPRVTHVDRCKPYHRRDADGTAGDECRA